MIGIGGSVASASGGDALAIVDGSLRWTWHDLDVHAGSAARNLAGSGIGRGDRVALLTAPSAAMVAALHGLARLGAVAAPLPMTATARELAVAVAAMDPRSIIVESATEAAVAGLERSAMRLGELLEPAYGLDDGPEAAPGTGLGTPGDPSAPAVAVLTSGTTGRPKVTLLSAGALAASGAAWLAVLPPATGWLLALGLSHVAGLGVVWRAAMSRVPLVIVRRTDPATILTALTADPAPSHLSVVPTMLTRLLDEGGGGRPPATIRAVLLGGGRIPPELVTRAIDAGWPIVPTYGLSEMASGVTAATTDEAAREPTTAGRALPGTEIRIVASERDGIGGIEVRGPSIFSGYLGDPDGTAAAVSPDGWLRTGDLGRLDAAGRLTVFDRRTDRIVRGGENIAPAEIELVLSGHPAIAEVAVVARRDALFGQVPIAAIVLRPGATDPADDDLIALCLEHLARFKVPAAFIRLDDLPRTSGGKLRRAELRARLDPGEAPSRDDRVDRPGGVHVAYRTHGTGPVHLLLLHGTLSTAAQLAALARHLVTPGDLTVHAVDRRGSGQSRLDRPSPIEVGVHVDDLLAILDAEGCPAAAVAGVSFGGVVGLELAARAPGRVLALVAYEPPYGPLADPDTRTTFQAVAATTDRAFQRGGTAAAAEAFMRGVAGYEAWERLPERTRRSLADEGGGAYVDAALLGLDPTGLAGITAPTTILTGDASEPFYRPIAEALTARIDGARHVGSPGMKHASPITEPVPVAAAIRTALAEAGLIGPDPHPVVIEEPTT